MVGPADRGFVLSYKLDLPGLAVWLQDCEEEQCGEECDGEEEHRCERSPEFIECMVHWVSAGQVGMRARLTAGRVASPQGQHQKV